MRQRICVIFLIIFSKLFSQEEITALKAGDKAPSFVLHLQQNSIQSITMPYLNRIVLIHFWSSSVASSKTFNKQLNRLTGRYKNALYKNAEGFETIAIAVQSDKNAWNESVKNDSLNNFINGIANRGYKDDICQKYYVKSLPHDVLIDAAGTIIAINPHIRDIEEMLDQRKNFIPIKKDVMGTLAMSSNPADLLKFGNLYLFDAYGDSIARTSTNSNGAFTFSNIKLNQDFILKVDNKSDIITSDPLALYIQNGEKILEGQTSQGGFVFYIPSKLSYLLTDTGEPSTLNGDIGRVNVIKDLIFKNNAEDLTSKDEQELNTIYLILQKNKSLSTEVSVHTDAKLDSKTAMNVTNKQSNAIKNYFIKKGLNVNRIKILPKGNTQPRKKCPAVSDCDEDDHKLNRRVEFVIFKS